MAVCTWCELEMHGSASCVKVPIITDHGEFDEARVLREIDDRDRLERGVGRARPTGGSEDAREGFDVLLPTNLATGVLALTAAVCNDGLGQRRISDVLKGAPSRYGVSVRVIPTSGTFDPLWYLNETETAQLGSTWYPSPLYDPFARWRRDLEVLERAVGTREALDDLDTETPLPDEPFDWTDVPVDLAGVVASVLERINGCAAALFDNEFRTVCQRLLARICTCDASVIRRIDDTKLALAVCWLAARGNLLFTDPSRLRVRDLTLHFGIAEPNSSNLANALMRAGGFDFQQRSEWPLGSPRYLTSARRRQIGRERDACRAKLRPH